jgi:hypothetical protein
MIDPRHERFLTERLRTHEIRHSGRDFYTHLKGTHDLLESWGNPVEVCLAGLYHSIYGTKHFRRKAHPIADRATIRGLIGERAERLAYVFCVTARPRAFLGHPAGRDTMLHDNHANRMFAVCPRDLNDLLEIEAANLIEQGGKVRSTLERLRQASLSDAARGAINRWLAKGPSELSARKRQDAKPACDIALTATLGVMSFARYSVADASSVSIDHLPYPPSAVQGRDEGVAASVIDRRRRDGLLPQAGLADGSTDPSASLRTWRTRKFRGQP